MTRFTREQYVKLRNAAHMDAIRKFYQDLEDDQVVHGRQGASKPLATRAGNQADRGIDDVYHWSTIFVSLTPAI